MVFTKEDSKIMKGIAVLFMLYHHLFAYPDRISESCMFVPLISFGEVALATYIAQYIRTGLAMFIFLSGYGTYLSSLKTKDLKKMTVRRIWGLYKQVWMVFFLTLPVSVYINRAKGILLLRDAVYNAFGLNCTFNKEWWFIVPFVLLLIVFPALRAFMERKGSELFTDVLCVVLYSAFYNYVLPEIISQPIFTKLATTVLWDNISVALGMLPAFMLGCIFAKYKILDFIKDKLSGKLIWCIVALIGLAALFYLSLYNDKFYNYINGTVMICCITVLLPLKIMKLPCKIFSIASDESTFLWLTHSFFCYYWCQKLVYTPRYTVLIFIWLVIISYAASKFIKLFWKYAGKAVQRVFGNRAIGEG